MKINRIFFSIFCSLSFLGSCAAPEGAAPERAALLSAAVAPDPTLPAPFPEHADDDSTAAYDRLTNGLLRGIPGELIETVGTDAFEAWLSELQTDEIVTDIGKEANLYTFLRDFSVDRETAETVLTDEMTLWAAYNLTPNFTEDSIEILLNGEKNAVAECFVSDSAIYRGGAIFTPEWLYHASEEQYEAYGIPKAELLEKVDRLSALPFTEEAAAVLEEKIGGYTKADVRVRNIPEASENLLPTVIEGEFLPDFNSYEDILLNE